MGRNSERPPHQLGGLGKRYTPAGILYARHPWSSAYCLFRHFFFEYMFFPFMNIYLDSVQKLIEYQGHRSNVKVTWVFLCA